VLPPPIVPDYAGSNVRGIVPALLGPASWERSLPDWMPAPVAEARQAVLLVLDGLGWDQLESYRALMPTVGAMHGSRITTVAPTTTSTALSSIATGLTPGEHGLIGYRMVVGGEILNVLRWSVNGDDRRRAIPPPDVQRFPAFLGHAVPVVSPFELCETAFSEAHLRGSVPVAVRATSSLAVEIRRLLLEGERFVYAYYGNIDKIAHERGFGEHYEAELRTADRLVADVLEALPDGSVLLITADHGQVEVGDRIITPSPDLVALCSTQSGEGRFRWFHAKRGAAAELLAAVSSELGRTGWVMAREEMIAAGWFGPTVPPAVSHRLGDVAAVACEPVSYYDPADTGPFDLVCRHGSLTSAEVYVPLLAGMHP
jgi:hypothetical protein